MDFFNENTRITINILLKFVPSSQINSIPGIGSDNGLAPIRRQAIIWANDFFVYWRIYASLGLNEWKDSRYVYQQQRNCF